METLRVFRASELVARFAEEQNVVIRGLEREGTSGALVIEYANHAHSRRRIDRASLGLIVERHVARDDRRPQLAAGVADAADALGELPHDLRPLRRAEVQTVRDGHGTSSTCCDVA